jgi:hypothetical protein
MPHYKVLSYLLLCKLRSRQRKSNLQQTKTFKKMVNAQREYLLVCDPVIHEYVLYLNKNCHKKFGKSHSIIAFVLYVSLRLIIIHISFSEGRPGFFTPVID